MYGEKQSCAINCSSIYINTENNNVDEKLSEIMKYHRNSVVFVYFFFDGFCVLFLSVNIYKVSLKKLLLKVLLNVNITTI